MRRRFAIPSVLMDRRARRAATLYAAAMLASVGGAKTSHGSMPDQLEQPQPLTDDKPPILLSANYASDLNANLSGGDGRRLAYLGKLALIADADLDRLAGISSGIAHISIVDIHGVGLSSHFVRNLATVSGIEAEPAIRLNQAWIEVGLGRKGRLRLGKFPAAQSFMLSDTAALFVNATFGWPMSFATDLPSGGPSWPLAAPGAMITMPLSDRFSLSGAVFAGDPAGNGTGDPQRRDGHGFHAFDFAGRPFVIGEAAATFGPSTWKVGGWFHFGRFARPGLTEEAAANRTRGDWAAYGVVDLPLIGSADRPGQLHAFARFTLSPADRNPIDLYVDAGVTLTGPSRGRPDDAVGLAISYGRLTGRLTAARPPQGEWVAEFSYRAALTPKLSVQPNVQLVVDPIDPTTLGDKEIGRRPLAMVLGLHTCLTF